MAGDWQQLELDDSGRLSSSAAADVRSRVETFFLAQTVDIDMPYALCPNLIDICHIKPQLIRFFVKSLDFLKNDITVRRQFLSASKNRRFLSRFFGALCIVGA